MVPHWFDPLQRRGFAVVPGVFPASWLGSAQLELDEVLKQQADGVSIRSSKGAVYAARNVLELTRLPREALAHSALRELLFATLGDSCGLVRVLFFDKPPERTWSLPWHRDMTIAVQQHRHSERYGKPTLKAGVPHVEAPREILEQMLTLRIHLDPMTEDNGPLEVQPGSHATDDPALPTETVYLDAGDVFAMRPLLRHRSGASRPGTSLHRRVLHLEFAAGPLDEGFEWHDFLPVSTNG
ncbi:MAG: phytanoyl-CoA dioxygenase family protein [Planctomycetales bacterium]|nr:phytanoyl-CoA dioxygenase family protein [Planctomycetales bacterium]